MACLSFFEIHDYTSIDLLGMTSPFDHYIREDKVLVQRVGVTGMLAMKVFNSDSMPIESDMSCERYRLSESLKFNP